VAGRWLSVYERLDAWRPRVLVGDAVKQCAAAAMGVALLQYTLRYDISRPFLGFFAGYSWVLLVAFRLAASRAAGPLRRIFAPNHYVLVVGAGERALRMARELESYSEHGVRLLGLLEDVPGASPPPARYKVYPAGELPTLLRQRVVDEIIFAVDSDRLPALEEMFLLCDEEGVRTRLALDFFPHVNSAVSLERFGETPLLTFSAAPADEIRLLLKRVMDVTVAAIALAILSPFMILVVALIRMTSSGAAIFRQERCGLNGRRFVLYKFRSMCEGAEKMRAQLEHLSTRETALKIPNDPRLTSVGRFLRKYSIDEWPQLWNVLRGDMSLVGPRPAVPEEVEKYKRWQRRRLRMRPGLTCTWAVSGRDHVDFETWMKLDMEYIDNWSLALDWKVLLLTVPHVLTGSGAN
jgi:exopolysaccharide biosynthesis polyprenyl glycosylphosphotransferase